MSLIKTITLSGVATLSKILSGILILKVLAIYIGPAGVGVAGQFLAFTLLFSALASGGIELGLIKYVAEYCDDEYEFQSVIFSAALFSLFVSGIFVLFGVIWCKPLAFFVFRNEQFSDVIFWLSCSLFCFSIHLILLSIFRGLRQVGRVTNVMLLSSLANFLLAWVLTRHYGVQGALYAIVCSQLVLMLITLIFAVRQPWFAYLFKWNLRWDYISDIKKLAFVRIVQLIAIPLSQVIVRSDLNFLFGWHNVGYWQGVLRISDAFLLFAQVFITSYYLPRLSSMTKMSSVRAEIQNVFIVIMPMVLLMLSTVYFIRDFVIVLIYSPDFLPASELFLYQFIGDAFRIAGLLFGYVFIAKAKVKMYILCELMLGALFIILSYFFARLYGVVGVTYAFAGSYCIYFLIVMIGSLRLTRHTAGHAYIPA